MGYTIDLETAEAEFMRFCQSMKIKTDRATSEEFANKKAIMVEAIREERLVIAENGNAVFKPEEGAELVFKRPRGQAFIALGKTGKDDNAQLGVVQSAAELAGVSMARMNQLFEDELLVCIAVRSIFLV